MNISAITNVDAKSRRNLFIEYANSFMSFKSNPDSETTIEKPENEVKKVNKNMGIETLTIFPKQVIDGKTIITA